MPSRRVNTGFIIAKTVPVFTTIAKGHEDILTGSDIEDPSDDAESNTSVGDWFEVPPGWGEVVGAGAGEEVSNDEKKEKEEGKVEGLTVVLEAPDVSGSPAEPAESSKDGTDRQNDGSGPQGAT